MNKLKLLPIALLAAHVSFAQITNPSPYCAAGYDDGVMVVPHYITNVTLGTLNNTSGSTQYAAPHYVYYNNIAAPNLVAGNNYPLSVTHDGGVSIHFVAVYIDFNHNGSFADAGELVLEKDINGPSIPNPSTATVTIPAAAAPGITRMRVMVFEDDEYTWTAGSTAPVPCTADATGSLDWGETEDYNINITSGTIAAAPVARFGATPLTGSTATNFTFTDSSTNTPTAWKWTFTPATVAYQSGTSATTANPVVKFTATGIYTVKLRVSNATGADSITKTNYITVGSTGVATVADSKMLQVYPNPASQVFYFDAPDVARVTIYDMQGRVALNVAPVGNSISVEALPAGNYVAMFATSTGLQTCRIEVVK